MRHTGLKKYRPSITISATSLWIYAIYSKELEGVDFHIFFERDAGQAVFLGHEEYFAQHFGMALHYILSHEFYLAGLRTQEAIKQV